MVFMLLDFSIPSCQKNEARIRVQISAAMNKIDLDKGLKAFVTVGEKLKII